jgi:hypothetical protein
MRFKIGDKVRIVNYGSKLKIRKDEYKDLSITFPIIKEEGDFYITDMSREKIGKETIITKVSDGQYATELVSWLNDNQLELVNDTQLDI